MTTPAHTHTPMSPPPDTPQSPEPDEATAPDPGPPVDPALVAGPAAAPDPVPAVESKAAAGAALATPWTVKALLAALTAAVTVVGGALTALLVYEFNSIDARFAAIDARFAAIDARFAAIDARFANLETDIDTRFDSLEAGQAEIARTLAVLIAELNARAAVDAALAGRLLAPDATVPVESTAPSP